MQNNSFTKPQQQIRGDYSFHIDLKKDMKFKAYWDGACSADKILTFAPEGKRTNETL